MTLERWLASLTFTQLRRFKGKVWERIPPSPVLSSGLHSYEEWREKHKGLYVILHTVSTEFMRRDSRDEHPRIPM